ncbi:MAG: S-methyl-5-thioribose-1-phosphate isomerase [Candidatus Altiarchaeota archaeon]
MNVDGRRMRSIWAKKGDDSVIQAIDQRHLPHNLVIEDLRTSADVVAAIRDMHVRGAPLIGATAAYGMYLAALEAPKDGFDGYVADAAGRLKAARPTAVNLQWAVGRQLTAMRGSGSADDKIAAAFAGANAMADEDAANCRLIGEHGLKLLEDISRRKKGGTVNILTHCNAGWLACVDYGTATAPMYAAYDRGIPIHVWVDETRPRNQGANLTAWELGRHGVPHTVIVDNAGGHLMQHGRVDMVIVGSDRTTYTGYVANKIGTYLKALAAKDNGIPFYVALPSSTFDWRMRDGLKEIPIEERDPDEVRYVRGLCDDGIKDVLITPKESRAANFAFDVTPPGLVSGLITERGVCAANEKGIRGMFPEKS